MAAENKVNINVELTGLGQTQSFNHTATGGTTPTAWKYGYATLASADTAEALDTGDVSTITSLTIRAVTLDSDLDLDYVSSFDTDLTVKAGEPAAHIPNPGGTVYWKNNGSSETPVIEYLVVGTT